MTASNNHFLYHSKSVEDVLSKLDANPKGLSEEEATRRRKEEGENVIDTKQEKTALKVFLRQFKSPLILALIVASIISLVLSKWTEAAVILAAVIVNSGLGFYQEYKAERALSSLTTYIQKTARVMRGGTLKVIKASELTVGDIIRVRQGDQVSADARLITARHLKVDESTLTGESMPVDKSEKSISEKSSIAEQSSMLWNGTMVTEGFADAVVTAIGEQTELGKIAKSVRDADREETPMQKAVANFSKKVGIGLLVIGVILFIIGVSSGETYQQMFFISLAIIVAAVPEGLPIAMTVVLASGVKRLAEHKGVVRRLLAAETLGSTSIILTDKTGTLTEGRMTLEEIIPFNEHGEEDILRRAIINTDVTALDAEDGDEIEYSGEPLEAALVKRAGTYNLFKDDELVKYEDVDWLPFSSERMYSATRAETGEQGTLTLLGAPEVLLERSRIDEDERTDILEQVKVRAARGERILAVAWKKVPASEDDIEKCVEDGGFEFQALLSFRDPIRPQVSEAVKRIKDAGVNTAIVTGDHAGTAGFVARSISLIDNDDQIMTGEEMSNEVDLAETVKRRNVKVFARVSPSQKVQLVRMYKDNGEIVAVTGDGVNDAPALSSAHIGAAMGSGTDVARGAADLVILDNNYATIVRAIEQGRRILTNIRKVIIFLMSDSFDEIVLIGGALLMGLVLPLNALQILYIKFFTDVFPSLAFTFEKGEEQSNRRTAAAVRYNLFDRQTRWYTLIRGAFASGSLFVIYWFLIETGFDPQTVRTFIFASVSTYILFLAFSMRRLNQTILNYNPFSNKILNLGIAFGMVMTVLAVYTPFLQGVLGTTSLAWPWVVGVLVIGFVNMCIMEALKYVFTNHMSKARNN